MKKEPVEKFDLEAAFKALEEIEVPVTEGIKANRVDLKERFSQKSAHDTLVEDYYNISSNESLEEAQEDREGEVAQAKLARIEKIVDLDAETPEDLLPSYVGKVIIQCPQCMTLFYKNPEDIEHSEENPEVVNINEICQHCGNSSGYTLIGKVDSVSEDEANKYEAAEEGELPEEESELDLDFSEPTEEVDAEGTGEADLDLDLDLTEIPEGEEEVEESLNHSEAERDAEKGSDLYTEHKTENVSLNEETLKEEAAEQVDESLNNSEAQKEAEEGSELKTENESENLTLNEEIDKDLDKKLKAHNDYIEYLKKMIEQEEEALKNTDNEEVKAAIQRRVDAFKADLEAALPDALKAEAPVEEVAEVVETEEAPAEEETTEETVVEEAPVEEALEEDTCKVVRGDDPEKVEFEGTKEECEKVIEKNKENPAVIEHGGLEIADESLNNSEAQKDAEEGSELKTENESENLSLNESTPAENLAKLDAFEAALPEDLEEKPTEEETNPAVDALNDYAETLTECGDKELKEDNFNVSDSEFAQMLDNKVFNEDLPTDSEVAKLADAIEHAGEEAGEAGKEIEEEPKETETKEEALEESAELTEGPIGNLFKKIGDKHQTNKLEKNLSKDGGFIVHYYAWDDASSKLELDTTATKTIEKTLDDGSKVKVPDILYSSLKDAEKAAKDYITKNNNKTPYVKIYASADGYTTDDNNLLKVYKYDSVTKKPIEDVRSNTVSKTEINQQLDGNKPEASKDKEDKKVTLVHDLKSYSKKIKYNAPNEGDIDAKVVKAENEQFIDATDPSKGSYYYAVLAGHKGLDKASVIATGSTYAEMPGKVAPKGACTIVAFMNKDLPSDATKKVTHIYALAKYKDGKEVNANANNARKSQFVSGVMESLSVFEDFDETSFNEHATAYLTEVYSNVKSFEVTGCSFDNNSLVVEGLINFESGANRAAKFSFTENIEAEALELTGTSDIAEDAKFVLTGAALDEEVEAEEATFITESLHYSYKINDTLVEGLK